MVEPVYIHQTIRAKAKPNLTKIKTKKQKNYSRKALERI